MVVPGKPKILIVDDDENIGNLVVKTLGEDNYQLIYARGGEEGLRLARQELPDLVVLDVMMPGMDGYEVCRRLRRMPLVSSIPVIMLTAMTETKDKVHGMNMGADDYVTKPFNIQEFRARVETHLRRSQRDIQASPLTGLPGNNIIEMVIQERITLGEPFTVCYLDLDNFKVYNDRYGFIAGDEVIKRLARITVEATQHHGDESDFIGHIGGDDFVVITSPDRAEAVAQEIINNFRAAIPSHYTEQDRQCGCIVAQDRQGKSQRFPLLSVSIVIVTNRGRTLDHPGKIAQIAAELKEYVKMCGGDQVIVDRRKDSSTDCGVRDANL
jgi:diguanylate cyclase (GGDEF)-like protein